MTRSGGAAVSKAQVDTIPGIGVVRVRALRKAGYSTLDALAPLTVDQLATVPGITPIKARQILDYVQSAQPARGRRLKAVPAAAQAVVRSVAGPDRGDPKAAETPHAVVMLSALSREASTLLKAEQSVTFERRLARQLGKLAALSGRLAASAPPKAVGDLDGHMARLSELLHEVACEKAIPKAKQGKLADRLRDRRKRLQRVLGDEEKDVSQDGDD